jgi:hypothetical protein
MSVIGSESEEMSIEATTAGTVQVPTYHEGLADVHGDMRQHLRYFTYPTDAGLVAGTVTSVVFTIERSAKDVWPYFKDFNLWQSSYGHRYSGIVGDLYTQQDLALGDGIVRLRDEPSGIQGQYRVLRVIPEYLIVLAEPIPEDSTSGMPEVGSTRGVSRGFHVFMLNEHEGQTVVTCLMEHAYRTKDKSVDDALAFWRDEQMAPEWVRKWRDVFIPTLKKLVHEGKAVDQQL